MATNTFYTKLIWFILCGLICFSALCGALWGLYIYTPTKVLFYTPYAIFFSALLAVGIWYLRQKDLFETIIVYCCYITAGFSFVFLAPYAVDRSLSTFIFFYAVEHNGFPETAISDEYMQNFYHRRLSDGTLGNFLEKDGNIYRPTWRAKVYYNVMYPVGIITNSLSNYQNFIKEVEKEN